MTNKQHIVIDVKNVQNIKKMDFSLENSMPKRSLGLLLTLVLESNVNFSVSDEILTIDSDTVCLRMDLSKSNFFELFRTNRKESKNGE